MSEPIAFFLRLGSRREAPAATPKNHARSEAQVDRFRRRVGIDARVPLLAAAIILLAAIPELAGCSRRNDPAARPNFILIVVDALRADRLHYAGYEKTASPNFDAFQRQSTWFANAYATTSWTIPSMASLFLSQLASQHRVVKWGSKLPVDETTLVEILRAGGYRTGGWTANRLMSKPRGFAQGFDEYKLITHPELKPDTPPGTEFAIAPASEVTRAALQWFRRERAADRDAPFFAYLHYLEPHTPYLCPDGSGEGCKTEAANLTKRLLKEQWEFDVRENDLIGTLYDVDVARMDEALGDLIRELGARGLLDDTWVILTSDHGEHLGESGSYVHGTTLNQPVVHVPLLFSPPSRKGSVVNVPVSLADVAPTILALAGLEIPDTFGGRSLQNALQGGSLPRRPVVAELLSTGPKPKPSFRHRFAVIDGTDALLLARDGTVQRFDLSEDPGQENPLEASMGELGDLLSAAGIDLAESIDPSSDGSDISPELLEHLKALGYIQ
jgi:arylsulfatase A-like enzyme